MTNSQPGGEGLQGERVLEAFELPSAEGNERVAMERVARAVGKAALSPRRLERLKTAVAEAVMNAMEHGNQYQTERRVRVEVGLTEVAVVVRVSDESGGRPVPEQVAPDLEAKLAGLQSPRGWGLFLIERMVDAVRVIPNDERHILELTLNLEPPEESS